VVYLVVYHAQNRPKCTSSAFDRRQPGIVPQLAVALAPQKTLASSARLFLLEAQFLRRFALSMNDTT
jgi:hypothetical protein